MGLFGESLLNLVCIIVCADDWVCAVDDALILIICLPADRFLND